MRSQKRLQRPTIQPLLQQGIAQFGWIRPAERIAGFNGSGWPEGAFVYVYADEHYSFNCLFALSWREPKGSGEIGGGASISSAPAKGGEQKRCLPRSLKCLPM